MWYLYILKCADGALYTGIATDPERRLKEHNSGKAKGSKCTRARLPVEMVYCEEHPDRSAASRREAEIKKWTRKEKCDLIKNTASIV